MIGALVICVRQFIYLCVGAVGLGIGVWGVLPIVWGFGPLNHLFLPLIHFYFAQKKKYIIFGVLIKILLL